MLSKEADSFLMEGGSPNRKLAFQQSSVIGPGHSWGCDPRKAAPGTKAEVAARAFRVHQILRRTIWPAVNTEKIIFVLLVIWVPVGTMFKSK